MTEVTWVLVPVLATSKAYDAVSGEEPRLLFEVVSLIRVTYKIGSGPYSS